MEAAYRISGRQYGIEILNGSTVVTEAAGVMVGRMSRENFERHVRFAAAELAREHGAVAVNLVASGRVRL